MPPTPARRRTLSDTRREAIVEATLDLVVELGYDRVSMDGVAARAGVGKATLYRWWPGKAELVVDAVAQRSRGARAVPDTGSLHGDLRHLVDDLVALVRAETPLLVGVGAALSRDPALAGALRTGITAGERERLERIVARAAERGEPVTLPVPSLAHELVPAVVFGRLLLTGDPLDDDFASALVDQVLLAVLRRPCDPTPTEGPS